MNQVPEGRQNGTAFASKIGKGTTSSRTAHSRLADPALAAGAIESSTEKGPFVRPAAPGSNRRPPRRFPPFSQGNVPSVPVYPVHNSRRRPHPRWRPSPFPSFGTPLSSSYRKFQYSERAGSSGDRRIFERGIQMKGDGYAQAGAAATYRTCNIPF